MNTLCHVERGKEEEILSFNSKRVLCSIAGQMQFVFLLLDCENVCSIWGDTGSM